MPHPTKQSQPRYVAEFHCLRSKCEDTCCEGWGVVIDKDTYDKYQKCSDPDLKSLISINVNINKTSTSFADYAQISLSHGSCPFLTEQRLCDIQNKLGEDHLSRTCSTFPRAMNLVNGVVEKSLYMSCPEAARLALLDRRPMRFVELEPEQQFRFSQAPTLDTTDPSYSNKPYQYFLEIRSLIMSLLQNRSYPVWERLVIVGLLCEQLDAITTAGNYDSIPDLLITYSRNVSAGLFGNTLSNLPIQPAVQLHFLLESIECRINADYTGPRFLECYDEFKQGIRYCAEASMEDSVFHYVEAYGQYYQPFMDKHEYIMENYLVNYVFKALFPFGPQQSLYFEQESIYTEYVLLVIHYAMVRSLLVGMAGHYKEKFNTKHVIKLVQSFAKAIEHNLPYLKRIVRFLDENDVNSLAYLAMLVKN